MFEGPSLKIERADKHIRELDDALNAFVETDFCRFGVEFDPKRGHYVLRFKMTKKPPRELGTVIGDAVHNLRSALDLAYCDILRDIGETPTDYSRFVFEEDREKLVAKLKSGPMKAAADIIDLLADVVKPYRTANNPLFLLHNLDISDKHFLLIPVFGIAQLRNVHAKIFMDGDPIPRITMAGTTLGIEDGGELNVVGLGGAGPATKIEFQGKGDPAYSITFGDIQGLKGHPVVPTLHHLSQLVGGTLQILHNAMLARKAT